MANTPLKMLAYTHDHLNPLVTGDVVPEGIDLEIDRGAPLQALFTDQSFQAGETSLGLYMLRTSQGLRDWVGLPVFPMRQFRHRCFLVLRDSPLLDAPDLTPLEGKRVGIDGWPNSGNTWTRVLLREAGVDIWKISWVVAPVEGAGHHGPSKAPALDLPSNVTMEQSGRSLVELLEAGEIDILVTAFLPTGFFEADSPMVHMISDYRAAEVAYFRRVGYCPGHHVLAIRRDAIERDPWMVRSLFNAFEESKQLWRAQRRRLQDTSPWLLVDLEETAALFGGDWNPYGYEANEKMLTDFCQDQFAQRLVPEAVDPAVAFGDFIRLMKE